MTFPRIAPAMASALTTVMILTATPRPAGALELEKFAAMPGPDQKAYVGSMFASAVRLLERQGRFEDARKVLSVFDEEPCQPDPQRSKYCDPAAPISRGIDQFMLDLDAAWLAHHERLAKGQSGLHVEHAFMLTLSKFGIKDIRTADFMAAVQAERQKPK